jgi:hypothetical protein
VKSLSRPQDKDALVRRLRTITPDTPRRWGRMSAHQMICHLTDAFLMGTDKKPVSDQSGWRERTIFKWLALYAPLRWPAGIKTRPEIDQTGGGGTKPTTFENDMANLEALMDLLTARPGFFAGRTHPIFGRLSEAAWMRWAYLHVDHHLRQFGA